MLTTVTMGRLCCLVLLVIFSCTFEDARSAAPDCERPLLLPYGPEVGDTVVTLRDDAVIPLDLNTDFTFFNETYNNLWIAANGVISFRSQFYNYLPNRDFSMPAMMLDPVIALFWADHDLESAGQVYYRTVYPYDKACPRYKVHKDLRGLFRECGLRLKKKPKEIVVVSWVDVDYNHATDKNRDSEYTACLFENDGDTDFCYCTVDDFYQESETSFCDCILDYGDYEFCQCYTEYTDYGQYSGYMDCLDGQTRRRKRMAPTTAPPPVGLNTYQAVLVSGDEGSYVIFNYDTISWTNATTNTGFGSSGPEAAVMGFHNGFYGDRERSWTHPYAGTDDIVKLVAETNSGRAGRWVYRVDGDGVVDPGECQIDPPSLQVDSDQAGRSK